ncbi:MAG: hypothetical protein NVS9B14_17420 [Candidatus Acidiferrum sp.]
MEETPRLAHVMTLLFLGTGVAIVTGLFVVLYGATSGKKMTTRLGALLVGVVGGSYCLLLLGTGIVTTEKTLPEGSWKYFCEPDCHIAYSISSVETAATLGNESNLAQANGKFVVVRLKTWFDEHSIAKFRGNGPLTPVPRLVSIVDAEGRRYLPTQLKPGTLTDASTPLAQALRPGESYLTTLVFDVPKRAGDLRLLVSDDDPMSIVTIDHENSPFHGKIYFSLNAPKQAAKTPLQ